MTCHHLTLSGSTVSSGWSQINLGWAQCQVLCGPDQGEWRSSPREAEALHSRPWGSQDKGRAGNLAADLKVNVLTLNLHLAKDTHSEKDDNDNYSKESSGLEKRIGWTRAACLNLCPRDPVTLLQIFKDSKDFGLWGLHLAGFPGGSAVKNTPAVQVSQETRVGSLGQEDPLKEDIATQYSFQENPRDRGAW